MTATPVVTWPRQSGKTDLFKPLEPYAAHSLCDVAKREVLAVMARDGMEAARAQVAAIADAFEDMALLREMRER